MAIFNVYAEEQPSNNPGVVKYGTYYVDRLEGGPGDDTLYGEGGSDFLLGLGGNDLLFGGDQDDGLSGGEGSDRLYGEAGNDTLNGGAGADIMSGGADQDNYIVDDANDIIIEAIEEYETDFLHASVSYVLAPKVSIEYMHAATPTDDQYIELTGNELRQEIFGNNGANRLASGGGSDLLVGRGGDDVYVVTAAGDYIYEIEGEGYDVVAAGVSYSLRGNQEIEEMRVLWAAGDSDINLVANAFDQTMKGNGGANRLDGRGGADKLLGMAGDDTLIGGDGTDILDGGAGNDTLIGGYKIDTLIGGTGDDTYIIDTAGDRVIEAKNSGYDAILASINYNLAAGQEIESIAASDANAGHSLKFTGNAFSQTITGNAGANVLDGGYGDDTLNGLWGNDTLIGGAGKDALDGGAGNDRLDGGAGVDTLIGGAGIDSLDGGSDKDTLDGGEGNDTLNGGSGADIMIGGIGNDTYYVDTINDQVIEGPGGGIDGVLSSVSYTLGADQQIEALRFVDLKSTAALNLTGNSLAQTITGNAGKNVLNGAWGNDVLTGGGEADTFVFANALGSNNVDRITDFGPEDTIRLSDDIFKAIAPGRLSADAFKNLDTGSGDANDRIYYKQSTGELFYDADGWGGRAMVKFAVLDNKPLMLASDFLIV